MQEHNEVEARRDEAEGVRLAYVAATRARDILIVPAVGDGPYDKGWIRPLNRALYPPRDQWQSPTPARGVPLFKGKQTIMPDARADGQPVDDTVRPGTYQLADPETGQAYSVTWWDPLLLAKRPDDARGMRREELISKDANPADVAADRAAYDRWRERALGCAGEGQRGVDARADRNRACRSVRRQCRSDHDRRRRLRRDSGRQGNDSARWSTPSLRVCRCRHRATRSTSSPRCTRSCSPRQTMSARRRRELRSSCSSIRVSSPRARQKPPAAACGAKRRCRCASTFDFAKARREQRRILVDGQVDLAYETDAGWVVVDFKTDIEIASAPDAYKQQVALYVEAVQRATGKPATGVLLRV